MYHTGAKLFFFLLLFSASIDWHNFMGDICAEDLNHHPVQFGGALGGWPEQHSASDGNFLIKVFPPQTSLLCPIETGMGCLAASRGRQGNAYCRRFPTGRLAPCKSWWCVGFCQEQELFHLAGQHIAAVDNLVMNTNMTPMYVQNFVDPVEATLHTNNTTDNGWLLCGANLFVKKIHCTSTHHSRKYIYIQT